MHFIVTLTVYPGLCIIFSYRAANPFVCVSRASPPPFTGWKWTGQTPPFPCELDLHYSLVCDRFQDVGNILKAIMCWE